MKALFEYFKDELGTSDAAHDKSAVELSEFQEDAVKKARRILARYDGVLIGDSGGTGQERGSERNFSRTMPTTCGRRRSSSARRPFARCGRDELRDATIAGTVVSQEELGRA